MRIPAISLRPLTLLPLLLLSLSACTSGPVFKISPQPDYWDAYVNQASQVTHWSINARAGFESENDGGFADLGWKQNADTFDIRIQGAFGSGSIRIYGDEHSAQLVDREGTTHRAKNVDELAFRATGWQIPVSGMTYWLRGLPKKGSAYQLIAWDERGHLVRLNQNGWDIEFSKFRVEDGVDLPRKIYMSRADNENINIKLVIRSWK